MMENLRVRSYGTGHDGALLVSVPDRSSCGVVCMRHILIDAGPSCRGPAQAHATMRTLFEDVISELDGRPLDLYVMTHRHVAHPRALVLASAELGLTLDIAAAWLPASLAPDYYEGHPAAQSWLTMANAQHSAIGSYLQAAPEERTPWLDALLASNAPREDSVCSDSASGAPGRTSYLCRGRVPSEAHAFQEAKFEVWAPEEDVSGYQSAFQPMALGLAPLAPRERKPRLSLPIPPAGVDAGAFYALLTKRRRGLADNLLAVDRAANDASLVFCLLWRGRRLLFAGHAGRQSWRIMAAHNQLVPVDFLQLAYHGGADGLPSEGLLERLLPMDDGLGGRHAIISTPAGRVGDAWDRDLVERALSPRCHVHQIIVESQGAAEPLDLWFGPREGQ